METIDREFMASAQDFIARAVADDKPFFVWVNTTRMHFWTHTPDDEMGLSGQGFYNDAMVAHDRMVGDLLNQLDELGVADNTIVLYSTDNGPHFNTWPDAGITPFRSEKNTNWEGGFRVPAMVRWPGKIPAGTIVNDIMSHTDWVPTLMAAAGRPDITESLKAGKLLPCASFALEGTLEPGQRRIAAFAAPAPARAGADDVNADDGGDTESDPDAEDAPDAAVAPTQERDDEQEDFGLRFREHRGEKLASAAERKKKGEPAPEGSEKKKRDA